MMTQPRYPFLDHVVAQAPHRRSNHRYDKCVVTVGKPSTRIGRGGDTKDRGEWYELPKV
ncbi:MAG: hypothetical protein P4L10_10525 [Acidobacteriaceae bacterium]|nr:hypothetical protein [Acidobacteriaceae bacterium]